MCRAIGVSGSVEIGGKRLARGAPIDGSAWATLAAEARLSVKHAASGREYTLSGPAFARPCRDGEEQVILARGSLKTSVGVGARPGAMVFLATPFGTVRYGEAALHLEVDDKKASVRVDSGGAWLDAAKSAKLNGPAQLIGPKAKATLSGKTNPKALEAAIKACESEAARARAQADDLIRHSKAPKLGERAKEHMQQRGVARTACLIAEATTGLAPEPGGEPSRRIRAANLLWQQLPPKREGQQ